MDQFVGDVFANRKDHQLREKRRLAQATHGGGDVELGPRLLHEREERTALLDAEADLAHYLLDLQGKRDGQRCELLARPIDPDHGGDREPQSRLKDHIRGANDIIQWVPICNLKLAIL